MRPHPFAPVPALFVLAMLALLGGCQSLQDILGSAPKPTARVVGANLRGLDLDHAALLFDVEVNNPYGAKLPLIDLAYSLGSGGKKVLEGSVKPTGSIPARGAQVIQLPVNVRFSSLLGTLKGVKPGSVVPYKVDFIIGVDAPVLGRLDVPFSHSGELPVPTVPQVELASFDVGRLSLDQTRATAKLQVKNTNQFPLDLAKLGISFSLGGQEIGSSKLANAASLQPGQVATLQVPLSFSPRALGVGLMNLLRSNQIAYRISGSIEANSRFGPIMLPFSHIGNTPISR